VTVTEASTCRVRFFIALIAVLESENLPHEWF